jgi:hypothetical protein
MKKEMRDEVIQLVGEASMCWDTTGSAIFDSTKAIEVGEKIITLIENQRLLDIERLEKEVTKMPRSIDVREVLTLIQARKADGDN